MAPETDPEQPAPILTPTLTQTVTRTVIESVTQTITDPSLPAGPPHSRKMTICEAFAREEGYGVPNGRATRNNNPGDIIWGSFAQAHGATHPEIVAPHAVAHFAFFPDPPTGFAAMKTLLLQHYKGLTITQTLAKYAPSSDDNNTASYIANVCKWTGLTPDTIIDDHL